MVRSDQTFGVDSAFLPEFALLALWGAARGSSNSTLDAVMASSW
jgi:hypothetical protein